MDEIFYTSEFYQSLEYYDNEEKQESIKLAFKQKNFFNKKISNANELILSI
jgi:hypothetical protein